jgi:hypothetical protein
MTDSSDPDPDSESDPDLDPDPDSEPDSDSEPESDPDPDPDSGVDLNPPDRNPYTANGRGPGDGEWLETQAVGALERWGYHALRNVTIYCREVDVLGISHKPIEAPNDYLLVQCKDWADGPLTESVIDRLVMLAFTARAMPVLITTTDLSRRAWQLAQAWDVNILELEDLQAEKYPELQAYRDPPDADDATDPIRASAFRERPPFQLTRPGPEGIEAPVFGAGHNAPGYVADRQGHDDYHDIMDEL